MRLATIRVAGGTRAVRIDGGQAVETGHADVGALLAAPDWRGQAAAASGQQHAASSLDLAGAAEAAAAIAGFTVLNDVTMRDWQYRTTQWLQGKTFEATTPIGPVLVTPDERPGDVIATGTPGGVGHARKPPRYLAAGMMLTTEIKGIGRLENAVEAP
jgi:acylpyruvate hydrolase